MDLRSPEPVLEERGWSQVEKTTTYKEEEEKLAEVVEKAEGGCI